MSDKRKGKLKTFAMLEEEEEVSEKKYEKQEPRKAGASATEFKGKEKVPKNESVNRKSNEKSYKPAKTCKSGYTQRHTGWNYIKS